MHQPAQPIPWVSGPKQNFEAAATPQGDQRTHKSLALEPLGERNRRCLTSTCHACTCIRAPKSECEEADMMVGKTETWEVGNW